MKKKIAQYGLFFFILLLFDRISKLLALKYLMGSDVLLTPGINLTLTLNRGVTFGWCAWSSPFFYSLFTLFIVVVLAVFCSGMKNDVRDGQTLYPQLMILAGACSNVMDRVWYGSVVDFIDLFYRDVHWYTFNVADSCIVLGIALLLMRSMKAKAKL